MSIKEVKLPSDIKKYLVAQNNLILYEFYKARKIESIIIATYSIRKL